MDNLPDTQNESNSAESSSKSEGDDETLDPRVPIELERLNHAGEAINHLELQLGEARIGLKELLELSTAELSQLEKSIGSAVSKARSYYDTRIRLRDAKENLTKAKHRFERAQALHVAAKELALVSAEYIDEAAEEKSNENAATWNETYRHAMVQMGDAEREKYLSDLDQQHAERIYSNLKRTLERLEKDYRRSINKSQPYYAMKAEYHKELEFQKRKISGLEKCVYEAKIQYQESLKNLDNINNEIHAQRDHGKMPIDLGEQPSIVHQRQITEIKPIITKPIDPAIRSCLLRTEGLPSGVIASTTFRYSSQAEESISPVHNQFILRSNEAPQSTIINHAEQESLDLRERLASISSQRSIMSQRSTMSQISQTTDDDDNKSGSIHVLSDEQLHHLAYDYYSDPSEISYSTDPIDALLSQFENSTLQAKTFFRNLFKN